MTHWSTSIRVGQRRIGAGEPTYVIAEVGQNHNGDVGLAREMVAAAAGAGADAVKFQGFSAAAWWSPSHTWPQPDGSVFVPSVGYEKYELSQEDWQEVAACCGSHGVDFMSSVFDLPSLELLEQVGPVAYKIASGEFTDVLLIAEVAKTGRPLILSTGMATADEVERTLDAIRAQGHRDVVLLKCTASYPTPLEEMHIRGIETLREIGGTLVGLSDHSESPYAAMAAVSLGAAVVERHFTTDRSLPGFDQQMSIVPDELASLVGQLRALETALGESSLGERGVEGGFAQHAKRSICATSSLPAGHVLRRDDLETRRPPGGIDPYRWPEVVGRALTAPVPAGEQITWELVG